MSLLTQPRTEIADFKKEFHGNILEAVSNASAAENIKALKTLKSNEWIFQAPDDNCRMFDSLPVISGKREKQWKDITSGLAEGQMLLGLYTGEEKIVGGKVVQDSALILRQDTNRWTLVHEMMHFLFHKWEVEEGVSHTKHQANAKKITNETTTIYSIYEKSHSGQDFKNFVERYSEYVKVGHESLKRGPLEEATVENTLASRFVKGLLTFVPDEDAYNNWYLNRNLEKAKGVYIQLLQDTALDQQTATEAIADLETKRIPEIEQKLADLVVDSPQTEKERDDLHKEHKRILARQKSWEESLLVSKKRKIF